MNKIDQPTVQKGVRYTRRPSVAIYHTTDEYVHHPAKPLWWLNGQTEPPADLPPPLEPVVQTPPPAKPPTA